MPRTGLAAEELKEKVIDAALARIRLVGFEKTRLTDVARDIGVSHATLYAYFADKAALLDAVTERWMTEIEEAVGRVAASSKPPEEKIVDWLVTLYRVKRLKVLKDPEPFQAFNIATALDKTFVVAHLASLLRQLAALVAEAGLARDPDDTQRLAALLYRATAAFHHPTLVAHTAAMDLEAELREIVAIQLHGMKAAGSP